MSYKDLESRADILSISACLQNIPRVSGLGNATLSTDYDEDRYYLLYNTNIGCTNQSLRKETSRIFKSLKGICVNMDRARNELYINTNMTFAPNPNRIFNGVGIWAASTNIKAPPIKYTIENNEIALDEIRLCNRLGILPYLPTVMELLRRNFDKIKSIKIDGGSDPEINEEWVLLNIYVRGEADAILDMYDKYTDDLLTSIPPAVQNKIRLSLNLA